MASRTPTGFTLIEVLVALSLGSVICYAAYVTIRVGSQCVTAVNRLSLENQVLRSGMTLALDELDFWTSYDHPDDPARQPLRRTFVDPVTAQPAGLPFRPVTFPGFNFSTDLDLTLTFDPSDPRAWYRGNPCHFSDKAFGDHSRFARIGDADPARGWYGRMIRDIGMNLGYYAVTDYMPCNTIFCYYDETGATPREVSTATTSAPGTYVYSNHASCNNSPRDLQGVTEAVSYVVTADPDYIAAGFNRRQFRQWYAQVYGIADARPVTWDYEYGALDRSAAKPASLLSRPQHWPECIVTVKRFISYTRHMATAKLMLVNPQNGQQTKLFFTTVATTLRGARRQRDLDAVSR
jgi:prepilin-type N-terminal cleavage/methylation domain-containing protein